MCESAGGGKRRRRIDRRRREANPAAPARQQRGATHLSEGVALETREVRLEQRAVFPGAKVAPYRAKKLARESNPNRVLRRIALAKVRGVDRRRSRRARDVRRAAGECNTRRGVHRRGDGGNERCELGLLLESRCAWQRVAKFDQLVEHIKYQRRRHEAVDVQFAEKAHLADPALLLSEVVVVEVVARFLEEAVDDVEYGRLPIPGRRRTGTYGDGDGEGGRAGRRERAERAGEKAGECQRSAAHAPRRERNDALVEVPEEAARPTDLL